MKKAIKYIGILLGSFLSLLLLLYIGASIYLNANKEEIIAKIAKTVESKFQSIVTIEDLDIALFQNFPNLSLEVKNLDVKGPMFNIHGKKLFTASRLYISIATHKLLIGKVIVGKTSFKNGNLFIYTDSTGLSNLSHFSSPNKKPKNNKPLDLPRNIEFVNVDLTIQDVYREKYFSFLLNKLLLKTNSVDGGDEIKIDQDILVKSLAFNLPNGSFLKKKLGRKIQTVVNQEFCWN